MPVTLSEIPLPAAAPGASPGLHGVLAVPEGEGPWPAVVVVHEAFGVTDVMRRQAERLAEAGFLALMPDLFSAGGARRCLVATFRTLAAGEGRAFVDVESARRALLARADCTGRVGVIGFCMGGGFALAAASRGFDASSVNYGMLPEDIDGVLEGACPIVASYGGRDRQLAGSADRLEAALSAHGIARDVREYPAAGHSFLNDAEMGPRPLRPVLRAVGMGPEPASAADAWRRIDAFLHAHLRDAERTGA
ncbi:dienelactone hydrolase family protein [Clavibacter nebraskensis]|uniref:Dienelactone hydrolase n=3 Tax=Clavibacter nebraskensis TaxID=31963 RepID=A0AAI8ZI98_9MICO|nr:dienelactone hydrolase family protein [Clavibacter nebraskensis]KXU20685.1 carboxymethylenebutenolidase [Clavibacter nebraskensis]OAH22097.1 carboxymethylenebutenolidase [Clavibacter nebraskensis]QGV66668.1 dienelactone hydrolase family protein [Clavibacter nebraskensis]QGV69465.1 dienelactone hydrolase family protein [Clavibacter nebraskensis]QGV72255.1 dienelactone hydrolase family protein [Clavibacter nebraskensis]